MVGKRDCISIKTRLDLSEIRTTGKPAANLENQGVIRRL